MQEFYKQVFYLSCVCFFTMACNDTQKECPGVVQSGRRVINPNGDSELALLMREMYDELEQARQHVEKGESFSYQVDHQKILTAKATEPEKAASEEYKAFADVYLQNVQALQSGSHPKFGVLYKNVVNSCVNCHKELCPGPIVKIQKLY